MFFADDLFVYYASLLTSRGSFSFPDVLLIIFFPWKIVKIGHKIGLLVTNESNLTTI